MNYKVMFSHNRERGYVLREGKEVYRHPEGRFIVLEFQGDATLMRRVLELAARGKERGCCLGPGDPRIRAKEGRDEAGLYHTSIQG